MQQGRGNGMLIGQKGVKYGLIVPGRGGSGSSKPGAHAPPGVRKPTAGGTAQKLAAFGGNSDSEEEDVGTQVARQAARKRSDTKVQDMYAAALAEDPTAFDYDGVYEEMQAEKAVPRQQERLDRRPKYIATLLEQAQLRKRDEDIAFERRQLKERSKEDHMYDDSERFVTAAYRRKLEEDKKWQEEQKQREAEEAANDVTKLGHMGNFYKNLMKKNVAFGAAQDAAPAASTSPKGAGAAAAPAADASKSGRQEDGRDGEPDAGSRGEAVDADGPASTSEAAKNLQGNDATSGGHHQQQQTGQAEQQMPGSDAAGAAHAAPGAMAAGRPEQRQETGPSGSNAAVPVATDERQAAGAGEGAPASAGGAADGATSAAVGGKRRNDEDAVAAARARYLARKQRVK